MRDANSRIPRRNAGGQDLLNNFDRSQIKTSSASLGEGAIVTILSAIVICVSVGFIGWTLLGQSGGLWGAKAAKADQPFSNEPKAVARDYDMSGDPGYVDSKSFHMRIDVNRTSTGLDAIDSELHERCTKPISPLAAEWSVKRGTAYIGWDKAEQFLACTMRHQRNRFCDQTYRKRFAERVKDYLRVRTMLVSRAKLQHKLSGDTVPIAKIQAMQKLIQEIQEIERSDTVEPDFNSRLKSIKSNKNLSFAEKRKREKRLREKERIKRTHSSRPRTNFKKAAPRRVIRKNDNLGYHAIYEATYLTPPFIAELEKLTNAGLIGTADFSGLFSSPPEALLPYLKDLPNPC